MKVTITESSKTEDKIGDLYIFPSGMVVVTIQLQITNETLYNAVVLNEQEYFAKTWTHKSFVTLNGLVDYLKQSGFKRFSGSVLLTQ